MIVVVVVLVVPHKLLVKPLPRHRQELQCIDVVWKEERWCVAGTFNQRPDNFSKNAGSPTWHDFHATGYLRCYSLSARAQSFN